MNAPTPQVDFATPADAEKVLEEVAGRLRAGSVAPYLGPGLLALSQPDIPLAPEALAAFFATKVALPRRAKGNAWASAQHIESYKHRATVTAYMAEAFAPKVEPTAFHRHLATLPVPLIVDSWYDGAMRTALMEAARTASWGEAQGITRAGIGEDRWYRFYDAAGLESDRAAAEDWTTLLYKPHGAVAPAKNFLISDADYVEVLTEIDIQTPIPDAVKHRRTTRSFLFLGCRFNDQMLRTYARQVTKRSSGPHCAVLEPEGLSRNELKFLLETGLVPLAVPLARAVEILQG
ncbi:transcriptional regulator [Azorhizobium oxalatiphilum]|uniref:Transcriptional regulator n=1 Tax=Azorhizobium oxalatiphilum TaxID=980631 RepID=A0A917F7W1_9HYPH|nr:SIR2 family protein [Azorhizobium oxalatiphilum]GGF51971.1 transcriptional regulator [Azorhizobium oxalatiphilum]